MKGREEARAVGSAEKGRPGTAVPLVGLGASAGGLEAFKRFFRHMPEDSGLAFVCVQHTHPEHKSMLGGILGRETGMPAVDVGEPVRVEPDHIYLAPGDKQLVVDGDWLRVEPFRGGARKRRPIDVFFESLSRARGDLAVAAVLSGTLNDGARGLASVEQHGGLVLAQDPDTATHSSMPLSAINTGLVDFVLAPEKMPRLVLDYFQLSSRRGSKQGPALDSEDEQTLQRLLALVREQSGQDMGRYKRGTILRRTARRMGRLKLSRLSDYLAYMQEHPQEAEALFQDLLIGVTGFFRDSGLWRELRETFIPDLVAGKQDGEAVRAWVPGCSAGQEAYTLGMLLLEAAEKSGKRLEVQVFGTDIDQDALARARKGTYPAEALEQVPQELRTAYFRSRNGSCTAVNKLRDAMLFSRHNLVTDPPFTNMDLISCHNVLIYLESEIQESVVLHFHFALRKGGILALGTSESLGQHQNLFQTLSGKWKIFRRKGSRRLPVRKAHLSRDKVYSKLSGLSGQFPRRVTLSDTVRQVLLQDYVPATVVADEKHTIRYLAGPTDLFLRLPEGEPVMVLTDLVREGLRVRLRSALHKAVRTGGRVVDEQARVKRQGSYHPVRLEVRPLREWGEQEDLLLVSMQELPKQSCATRPRAGKGEEDETEVARLQAELAEVRHDLQATIEDLESANEELTASNEEIMSMNEELQSSNEELETSQEELQSLNEELQTLNTQLQDKLAELEASNNDLTNFIASTETATLFLDEKLRIRRFTPAATGLFHLADTDVGRPITDLANVFEDFRLKDKAAAVLKDLEVCRDEVRTEDGRWFLCKSAPFRTHDNRIQGVVLSFVDITRLKTSELDLQESEERMRQIVENIKEVFWIRDLDSREVLYLTPRFEQILGLDEDAFRTDPRAWLSIVHPEDRDDFQNALDGLLERGEDIDTEFRIHRDGHERWIWVRTVGITDPQGRLYRYAGVAEDVTGYKEWEVRLRRQKSRLQTILDTIPVMITMFDPGANFMLVNREFEAKIGWSTEEVKTIDLMAACYPDPEYRKEVWQYMRSGEVDWRELEVTTRSGRVLPSSWSNIILEEGTQIGIGIDLTEKIESELALSASEERFRASFEQAAVGMSHVDPEGVFLKVNQRLCDMLGYSRKELLELSFMDITHPEDLEEELVQLQRLADGKISSYSLEKRYLGKDGSVCWGHMTRSAVHGHSGEVAYFIGVIEDINQRKQAEAALVESEARFQQIARSIDDVVWLMDLEQDRILYASPAFEPLWQRSLEELYGDRQAWNGVIHPEDFPAVMQAFDNMRETGRFEATYRIEPEPGTIRWIRDRASVIEDSQGGMLAAGVARDVTGSIQDDQRLRQALGEKEVLLQEVHHRVKNNFQVISSLLNLTGKRIKDQESLDLFKDIRSKIQSMALIHTQIYQSKHFDRVDLAGFVRKLFHHLGKMYQEPAVQWELQGDSVQLPLEMAVPCGLAVNEALTNVYRHAFSSKGEGSVTVVIEHRDPGGVRIKICDNGVGLPQGFTADHKAGMGFRIMQDLIAHQLGGELSAGNAPQGTGTCIDIRFDLKSGDRQ